MSGFLPDLAGWALGGGAGANNDQGDELRDASSEPSAPPEPAMTADEMRARRLARMTASASVPPSDAMDVEKPSQTDAMDVDKPSDDKVEKMQLEPAAAKAQPAKTQTQSAALPPKAPAHDAKEEKQKRKRTKEPPSPADTARKLQRKKESLLKRTLSVALAGTSTVPDTGCVVVDIDDTTISVQTIAEILAARLSLPGDAPQMQSVPNKAILPYLSQCHKRASEELKLSRQKQKGSSEELEQVLEEIQKQVVSYAASSLMEPDLFELGKNGSVQLAKLLTNGVADPVASIAFGVSGPSSSFYHCLCEELISQEMSVFESVISDVVSSLTKSISKCDTVLDGSDDGGGLVVVSAMSALCSHKKAAQCLTKVPTFLLPKEGTPEASERITPPAPVIPPGASSQQQRLMRLMQAMQGGGGYTKRSGPGLEKHTVLGLVLRLGLPRDHPSVAGAFQNITTRSAVESTTIGMRRQLRTYQDACNVLIRSLITAGAEARGQVMKWITDALIVNAGASAMRPDTNKVSNPQTLLNLSVILLKLCEPFLSDDKKMHLIDPGFVSSEADHGGVYTMTGDDAVTRLGENPSPSGSYDPKNRFIPQCFFFTARALHFGIVPGCAFHTNLLRQINHTHWTLRQRNADLSSDPQFNHLMSMQHANEASLLAPEAMADTLRFFNLSAGVLLRMDDDQLPLMPEHFVDDICDIMVFVSRMTPSTMRKLETIFKMVVKLLSPKYAHAVRNYNLRAKLGDVLHDVYLPSNEDNRSSVPDSVSCDPLAGGQPYLLSDRSAQETLAPSLLLLYGEVEHTGYYEKMGHRANISALLKYLWESKEHRPAFRRITQNKESFIKFANGIMNETNSLIASVMEKLPEIRQVQVQMANPQEWAAIPEEQRETITSRHEDNESEVKRALPLCNKTLQMLGFLNTDEDIRNLFLLQEMCPRLVNMLLHVLTKLVGAKGLELKVDNPESYNFRPKEMLRDLCAIFASFASSTEFQVECAKSGYYNRDLVVKSVSTCRRLNLLTGETMERFASLCDLVEVAAKTVASDDALLHDAPEEFLDPLMFSFMKDPVLLPTSDTVIDRSTITQHLLNDPHDPFNRKDLTIDMVVPATELKERMTKWLEEKRMSRDNEAG